jgi:RHS repeat-associated protein
MKSKQYIYLVQLFCLLCLLSAVSQAQGNASPYDGHTPEGLERGGTGNSFVNVNLATGSLNFALPLLSIGGRGKAGYTMRYTFDKRWAIERRKCTPPGSSFCPDTGYTLLIKESEWSPIQPGFGPGVMVGRWAGKDTWGCSTSPDSWNIMLTRLTFIGPDGSEIPFVDAAFNGEPKEIECVNGVPGEPFSRGTVWYSTDASSATFIPNTAISDGYHPSSRFYPSGKLKWRDGTAYSITSGKVTRITDTNGNYIDFIYDGFNRVSQITDSLKRIVTITYTPTPTPTTATIGYKGAGGDVRTITITYSTTPSTWLRPDFTSTQTVRQAFPEFIVSDLNAPNQPIGDVGAVQITLADGRSYRLYYNNYAELARVDLPTGGKIEYDYGAGYGVRPSGALPAITSASIFRCVKEQRIFNNVSDATPVEVTRYRRDSDTSPTVVDRLVPGTTQLIGRTNHYHRGDPLGAMSPWIDSIRYPAHDANKEYKTESFASDGATLLRTVEYDYQPRVIYPWASYDSQLRSFTTMLNDISPNLISKVEYNYDNYNNVTQTREYGFVTGVSMPLLRRTHTDYLTNNLYQGDINYATDLNIHIRNLPREVNIYNGSGNLVSKTYLDYDRYDAFSIQDCPNIVQHDGAFNTSYGRRGNLTLVTKFATIIPGSNPTHPIYLHNQYNIAGNVVTTKDGRGNETDIDYSDLYGSPTGGTDQHIPPAELGGQKSYAFPTKVTNALGHETYTKYDYYLGRPVDQSDPNGVDVSWIYSDPLDRLTHVINHANQSSAKNVTRFVYYDNANRIDIYNDLDGLDDGQLWKQTFYDGLGRTYRSSSWENETETFSIVYTQRDALGRVHRVSNPFRRTEENYFDPPDEAQWTTTEYDALSRVVRVTTPDGSQVNTQYSGNQVTVTDQAGKRRRSETNALGQLTKVIEDPGGLGYVTTYEYDTLSNLRKVIQGSQERTFDYDSLSRLTSATNPESGPVSYKYDENGNLTEKTDARNIITKYKYDKLNRNTEVDYSNTSLTPDNKRIYDNTTPGKYGIGRLWKEFSRGDMTTGTDTDQTVIDRYDALGRPLSVRQHFKVNGVWKPGPGETEGFTTSVTYDIPGNVKTMTYPSGHTASYSHNSSGQLSGFSGNLGDGVNRNYSTDMKYDAAGLIKREQFGTTIPLYLRRHYNNRLQLFDIRLGTDPNQLYDSDDLSEWVNAPGSWNRGHLRFFYATYDGNFENFGSGGTNNNGNVLRVDHWVPGDDAVSSFARHFDRYSYDALNRIKSVAEGSHSKAASGEEVYQDVFQQGYVYDRWGNRTIDQGVATGGEVVWVDDGLPAGATAVAAEDGWNWISSNPSPYSGSLSHQSVVAAGAHQHYFQGATQTLDVNAGDRLYTYVYLDPANPPSEVMLQWNENGSFEHRAYWGANNIPWGVDGTESRRYMGPLPATGGWVRLEVQAILLGLEGKSINGMAFTLYGGRASWDKAGKIGIGSTGINTKAYIVDTTKNRLKPPAGGGTMDYDAAGNLVTDSYTNPTLYQFTYDQENRVVEAKNGGVLVGQYAYNAAGKRTRRSAEGQETWYVSGIGGELVAEYNANGAVGSPQKEYGYRNGQLLVVWDGNETGERHLKWLVQDHLGSTRMVVDRSGSLGGVRRNDFLPFGEQLGIGVGIRTASIGYGHDSVRQRFTGKVRDDETEMDYFSARYFASTQGRFTSVDPSQKSISLINPQSFNRYTYTYNNPLAYIDHNGKWPTWIHYLIIDRAFPGLNKWERYNIKRGSNYVDRFPDGHKVINSYQHGMTAPGQSIEDAAQRTSDFIAGNQHKASIRSEDCWIGDCYFEGLGNAFSGAEYGSALYFFGMAFHTVSDMTSPAHVGFQVWNGITAIKPALEHIDLESSIDSYHLGLAVGVTLKLYGDTFGPARLIQATNGIVFGSENDPTVQAIRAQYRLPGSNPIREEETLYEYRIGITFGLKRIYKKTRE